MNDEVPMGAEEVTKEDVEKRARQAALESASAENEGAFFKAIKKGLSVAGDALLIDEAERLNLEKHPAPEGQISNAQFDLEKQRRVQELMQRHNVLASGYNQFASKDPALANAILAEVSQIARELHQIDPKIVEDWMKRGIEKLANDETDYLTRKHFGNKTH